ncbi:MAG TPA: hypothetical protein PK762_04325 [Candidatus Kapabacteria bacterium]|nr:hypothetical protein [Candidatus Kapabacteria bacterium]
MIIIILDRLDQIEKTKIIANLIKSRVDEKIDLIHFFRLSNIVERAFILDLNELVKYRNKLLYQNYISDHLASLGLISVNVIDGGTAWNEFENMHGKLFKINKL